MGARFEFPREIKIFQAQGQVVSTNDNEIDYIQHTFYLRPMNKI